MLFFNSDGKLVNKVINDGSAPDCLGPIGLALTGTSSFAVTCYNVRSLVASLHLSSFDSPITPLHTQAEFDIFK